MAWFAPVSCFPGSLQRLPSAMADAVWEHGAQAYRDRWHTCNLATNPFQHNVRIYSGGYQAAFSKELIDQLDITPHRQLHRRRLPCRGPADGLATPASIPLAPPGCGHGTY